MGREDYKFSKFFRQQQDTRWAGADEIRARTTRLELGDDRYPACGLPVLSDGHRAWVDGSDTHSLIFGATGSKKTRLFCMPMLHMMVGAGESFVVTDPKGELYTRTSGYAAARGYNVVVLNYRDLSKGDTWNPLDLPFELYHGGDREGAITRLNDFVTAISQKQMENTKDIFWVNAARSIALSILLLMMESCTREECNLRTFTRFCVEFSKGTSDKTMLRMSGLDEDDVEPNYLSKLMELLPADGVTRLNYDGIANSSDRARGDIQSTLFTLVSVFMTQEMLVRNMSRNSFDPRALAHEKTAIYLIVPDEKTTYHFIATTFIKQCYETLVNEAQSREDLQLPVRVNFVLDEFANIPAIPDMPSMITAARSRNMRFFLVVQSMHQLKQKYGDETQTIKGNCENWVFLSSKEVELLDEISTLCGTLRASEEGGGQWPLISPSQLQRLSKQRGEALIFCGRSYPFISELADIDDYIFERCPALPMGQVDVDSVVSIDPKGLYTDIMLDRRGAPHAKAEGGGFSIFDGEEPFLLPEPELMLDEPDWPFDYADLLARPVRALGNYEILQNHEDEILIVLPMELDSAPENPVLYYDGGRHAILLGDGLEEVIICDFIHPGIRDDLAACTTLLIATKVPGSEAEEYDVEFVTAVCLVPGLEAFAEKLVERAEAEEESEEEEESETW